MILPTFPRFFPEVFFSSKFCWKGFLTEIGNTNLVVSTFWLGHWGWNSIDTTITAKLLEAVWDLCWAGVTLFQSLKELIKKGF